MTHCEMIQAGEIQAVIGDASRDGVGGRQYCGVWSLASKRRPFNAFGNSYAGLIPGEIRGKAPALGVVDESACVLTRAADEECPTDVRAEYRVVAPHYIDHRLVFTDRRDVRREGCDFREVTWCSYMNCPEDPRLHFRSGGDWTAYLSPRHGVGSNLAPAYIADSALERWPARSDKGEPFHWDRAGVRFDEPFYYGRLGDLALIFMFRSPQWLRFYCSPTGGGGSLRPGQACPAWDFEWVIPEADYAVGQTYELSMRMAYAPFVSPTAVLEEFRRFQAGR